MLVALCLGMVTSCDEPSSPVTTSRAAPTLRITLDISSTTIASVVAQVTGPDFDTITVNLQVNGDTATGAVEIPAGSDRLLTIHAYDAQGVETHRGQATLTIREGLNDPVTVVLEPLTGEQEITAVVGQIFVTIVQDPDTLTPGEEGLMAAIVTNVDGDTVTQRVQWGSLTPEIAKVDTNGVVTALAEGQARLVALYSGVAAESTLVVMTARDLMSVWITTAFQTWFNGSYSYSGPGLFLSNASFQHSAPWTNAGMVQYSALPRTAIVNDTADQFYENISHPWKRSYTSIRAVNAGLSSLDTLVADGVVLPSDAEPYRAFAMFTEGMAYATVAVLYDRGFKLDQGADSVSSDLYDYTTVMDTALAFFDRAIAIADTGSFTIPQGWVPYPGGMSATILAQVAHSMKARYRAAVARTPAERASVDWPAVIADVDAGVSDDWTLDMDPHVGWYDEVLDYGTYPGWQDIPYWVYGMADQSGNYQKWLAAPLDSMRPILADSTDVLVVTPDLRFPRGTTVTAQEDSPGTYYKIPDPAVDDWSITSLWAHPERQTWRWSYYWASRYEDYTYWTDFSHNEIDYAEMRLLKAEALYRAGDLTGAASLINVSRTASGLAATDASGSNPDCVPKMPDGTCGGLFEMLKWEKRMQVMQEGLFGAPWFFDARGWGDLYQGTFVQLPVPCGVLLKAGEACYTFGGGNPSSAPASNYAWPGEG